MRLTTSYGPIRIQNYLSYGLAGLAANSSVNFLTISFAPAALPKVGFVSNAFWYEARAFAFSPFLS